MSAARAPQEPGMDLEMPTLDLSRLEQAAMRLTMPEIPRPLVERYRGGVPAAALKMAPAGGLDSTRQVLQRLSMGWNLAEQERVEQIGVLAYLEEQLDPGAIDDQGLEDALKQALPTLEMSPGQLRVNFIDEPEVPLLEFLIATILRMVYSPRQLLERMTVFWSDHFNIYLYTLPNLFLKPADDRDVIRANALGKFPELLSASAHSPAMLDYLTNNSNVRDHPNENYARELMELHAMGVDGGYTEQDVKEVARCFTGWTYWGYDAGPGFGEFVFNPRQHDFEAKTVLGQLIPAGGGQSDAETVLGLLADHPSTAEFISTKLLRYMWGYEPPAKMIDKVARTYTDTGGDVGSMLWAIFKAGQLLKGADTKLKRPFHMMTSAMRALFAEVQNPLILVRAAEGAGHMPFGWLAPNGYPDTADYWSGFLLPRWNFASLALTAEEAGVVLDLPFLDPSMPADEIVTTLDALLLHGTMSSATREAVVDFLQAAPVNPLRLREAIGLVLASPEFQQY